jgi:hypothetical protein
MNRSRRPVFLFGLVLALVLAPTGSAYALTVDELVEFLEADVPESLILRLLESSGRPEELSSSDVVALWKAGASDRLMDLLLPEPAPAAEPGPVPVTEPAARTEPKIRAFYRDAPGGGQVFILTNLDDEGEKLDGKPTSGARSNLVTSRPAGEVWRPEEPPPPPPAAQEMPSTKVEVNVGHQAAPDYEAGHGPTAYVRTGYRGRYGNGFFYDYPISHFYPPGSYTHLKLYHQGRKPGLGHYQLPAGQIFYNPLYPTAGSHAPRRR